jgi:hypothetical protein
MTFDCAITTDPMFAPDPALIGPENVVVPIIKFLLV